MCADLQATFRWFIDAVESAYSSQYNNGLLAGILKIDQ